MLKYKYLKYIEIYNIYLFSIFETKFNMYMQKISFLIKLNFSSLIKLHFSSLIRLQFSSLIKLHFNSLIKLHFFD